MIFGVFLVFAILNLGLFFLLIKQWRVLNQTARTTLGGLTFVILPICWTMASALQSLEDMKQVDFCGSCHVMEGYLASLNADDSDSIPAVHYLNNYVPRHKACYECHTEYTIFGGVKAKLNGLKHVWVNYVAGAPEKIALYRPYANRDCLRCHGPAARFQAVEEHGDEMDAIKSGEVSCLECHDVGHILD